MSTVAAFTVSLSDRIAPIRPPNLPCYEDRDLAFLSKSVGDCEKMEFNYRPLPSVLTYPNLQVKILKRSAERFCVVSQNGKGPVVEPTDPYSRE